MAAERKLEKMARWMELKVMEDERLRVKALAEAHLMEVEERKVRAGERRLAIEEQRLAIETQVEMNKRRSKSAKSCSWMRAGWITRQNNTGGLLVGKINVLLWWW